MLSEWAPAACVPWVSCMPPAETTLLCCQPSDRLGSNKSAFPLRPHLVRQAAEPRPAGRDVPWLAPLASGLTQKA
jgi:hypothetical protein